MIKLRNVSPSALNTFKECELKFFGQYGLGYYVPNPWHSTILGLAAHHVFELIAEAKMLARDNKGWKKDRLVGRIYADKYPLEEWEEKAYNHYTQEANHLEWTDEHRQDFANRIANGTQDEWSVLNIDPPQIIQTELKVELPIEKDWAKEFVDQYEVLHKHLHMKGFVDLIYRNKDNELVFLDYKTGLNPPYVNWKTKQKKCFVEHCKDTQMLIYYHCVKRVFEEDCVGRIWYLSLKKPIKYELTLDDEYVEDMLERIRVTYQKIKEWVQPKRVCEEDKYGCLRLCPFSTMNMEDIGLKHLDIKYDYSRDFFNQVKGKACVCDALNYFGQHRTPEEIQEHCKKPYTRK